ncbi:MAG: hypothetical protein R2730_03450 [Chitinophagales bacterium]
MTKFSIVSGGKQGVADAFKKLTVTLLEIGSQIRPNTLFSSFVGKPVDDPSSL